MGIDFGNDVLPLKRDFSQRATDPPSATFSWSDVLMRLTFLLEDVAGRRLPGWTVGEREGGSTIIMYIPTSSVMSLTYTADMRSLRSPLGDPLLTGNLSVPTVDATFAELRGAESSR